MILATTLGNQGDGSIVDQYGNRISQQDSLHIISTVHGLPARQAKDDFLHAHTNHPIVIVQGETGSGKSTQLPKFAHFANPDSDIVVTQPRVLSATSLASRVSMEILAEMRDPDYALGKRIGYRTGAGGKLASHETRLAYHTDGTEFMRQSLSKKTPNTLFIDEVHGFSVQTEMLAMLSRYNTHAMRIVLMSATLDPEIFREYYKSISRDIPLIQIPGRTFEVEKDIDRDSSLMRDLRAAIIAKQDVLIFVPGKKEIKNYIEEIRQMYGDGVEVFPLHAEMPASQQNQLLTKTGTKSRIIVATNIAEESITIPGLERVMDLGKVKILRYDAHGTPMLCLEDTAMSNVLQRAGRAGRTKPGMYDRYSTTPSEDLEKYPTAPIEREMIDRHILTLLSHGVVIIDMIYEGEKHGESPFFHHVDIGLFQISLSRLKSIGALTNSNKLTVLGYELLKFPIDVYHARMLYESIERGCIGNMIPIVAILEKKGFVSKDGSWQDLLSQKQYSSDLDAYVEILDIVTSPMLTKQVEKKLIGLGIDAGELNDFYEQAGEKKLYEVVDLTPIGIKNKKLKEVDECRTILLSLFAAMGVAVTSSTDSKARTISLATGYLHNQYTYSKELKKFTHSHHGEYVDHYNQGDISVVEARDRGHYFGSPYIIGGDGTKDDFHILTQIIKIAPGVIREASNANAGHRKSIYVPPRSHRANRLKSDTHEGHQPTRSLSGIEYVDDSRIEESTRSPMDIVQVTPIYREEESNNAPDIGTPETLILNAIPTDTYESIVYDFQTTHHESSLSAQHFYLNYCLVPFLFQHNKQIREYISNKDEQWKQSFGELLKGLIEKHDFHRINLDNILKTEASFRQDTHILMLFLESNNSMIQNFRRYGNLPQRTRTLPTIITPDTTDIARQSDEVIALKTQYAAILGQTKAYIRRIALHDTEQIALYRVISELSNSKGESEAIGAYARILSSMRDIESLSLQENKNLSATTKGIGARRKEYDKYRSKLARLAVVSEILENPKSKKDRDELVVAMNTGYFGDMTKEDKSEFIVFFDRLTSDDARKRSRAIKSKKNEFKKYENLLNNQKNIIENRMFDLQSKISLDHSPVAKEVLSALGALIQAIFYEEYADMIMEPKLYKIMRTILGDSINEQKGLDRILCEGLKTKQMGQHMKGVNIEFNHLVNHVDLQYELETYQIGGAVGHAILESTDPVEVQRYIDKLTSLLEKLEISMKKVDKSLEKCTRKPILGEMYREKKIVSDKK